MKKIKEMCGTQDVWIQRDSQEKGFALAEFLISTIIVLGLSAGVFTMLADVQRTSGYQGEVVSVMQNTRVAMKTLERYITRAGNNPGAIAMAPVTIVGNANNSVRLCSDLTGSAGNNQGDADGDILDQDEDVTFSIAGNTLSITDNNAVVTRVVAANISNMALQYFDNTGTPTTIGANVAMIGVTITGASTAKNPRTDKPFGYVLTSRFTLPNRG